MTAPVRIATDKSLAYMDGGVVRVRPSAREEARAAILSFMDTLAVSTGRETFYNSKEEQEKAEAAAHDAVWGLNRGLYGAMLALPAASDRSAQLGLARLLDNPRANDDPSFLTWDEESRLVALLASRIPPQRLFKMFVQFAEKRINNKRTRNLILRSILGAGAKLPLWVVKYRSKVRAALRHALGSGVANGVAVMTGAVDPVGSGSARMYRYIDRYIPAGAVKDDVYQCVAYALGAERPGGWTVPILAATTAARTDLAAAAILPVEVLEGFRSQYHKALPHARVLEIAKAADTMTEKQKMQGQRAAKAAGVELTFDPAQADLTKLYVYALETGAMTPEVREAIRAKARRLGRSFPVRYRRIGVVLDASESMAGTKTQKWGPLAFSLAMRDVLIASATEAGVCETTGGGPHPADPEGMLLKPEGDTSLAMALVKVLRTNPDAVYVLTDGYENAPAGRVDEILRQVRALGIKTPVYQVTSVTGAEAAGVRRLSAEAAPMPVSRPEAIGLGVVRAALTADVEGGIAGLLAVARPQLAAPSA